MSYSSRSFEYLSERFWGWTLPLERGRLEVDIGRKGRRRAGAGGIRSLKPFHKLVSSMAVFRMSTRGRQCLEEVDE
jgi:hypothetical protein